MKYTFSRLLDPKGRRVDRPSTTTGIDLDIDQHGTATLFEGNRLVASLKVLRVEAHAAGIFLTGIEAVTHDRVMLQEWFLAYPK